MSLRTPYDQKIELMLEQLDEMFMDRMAVTSNERRQPKNILPNRDVDLKPYCDELIPSDMPDPQHGTRLNIQNHYQTLQYRMRGRPQITALLILTIAYARRRPEFVDDALQLFYRILDEQFEIIAEHLPVRFFVSIIRTFADYGRTSEERLLALSAYTYVSLIRAYEVERGLDGHPANEASFDLPTKGGKGGHKELRFRPGHDDALSSLNTLVLMNTLEEASPVSKVIQILLAEIANSDNLMTRIDRALEANPDLHSKRPNFSFGRPKHIR